MNDYQTNRERDPTYFNNNNNENYQYSDQQQQQQQPMMDQTDYQRYNELINNYLPKKKCAKCTMLKTFDCEHSTPVRDDLNYVYFKTGHFYFTPKEISNVSRRQVMAKNALMRNGTRSFYDSRDIGNNTNNTNSDSSDNNLNGYNNNYNSTNMSMRNSYSGTNYHRANSERYLVNNDRQATRNQTNLESKQQQQQQQSVNRKEDDPDGCCLIQ